MMRGTIVIGPVICICQLLGERYLSLYYLATRPLWLFTHPMFFCCCSLLLLFYVYTVSDAASATRAFAPIVGTATSARICENLAGPVA